MSELKQIDAPGRSDDSLRESDGPLQAVFDAMLDAIIVLDDERRYVDVNQAACVFLGLSREELLQHSVGQLSAPGQDPEAAWKAFRETGRLDGTWRFRRADGAIREAECRAVADFIPGRHLAVLRDVTERRRAEEILRESEERFRLAFDHAPIGMALVSIDGRFLQVNRALCDLTGYAEEELLLRTFQDITHADDLDADVELARRLAAGEIERFSMEKRYIHKLGHEVWILLHVSIVRTEQGEPLYFVSQIKDISDRKRAEEALRDSENRYRQLFETNPLPIWLYDPSTLGVLAVNDAAVLHYGYSREEFLAMTVKDLRPPEELPRFLEAMRKGAPVRFDNSGTWRHRKKDGTLIDVEVSVNPLSCEGGEARLVVAHDVTERRRAAEAVRAHARRQAAVAALGQRALQGLDPAALMAEAAALLTGTLDVELSEILERRPQRGVLLLRAGQGWRDGVVGRATVSAGRRSHAGFTLLADAPVVVDDVLAETRFRPSRLLREHGAVSGASVTIAGDEKPFGVLGAHSTRRRAFTTDDVHFLQAIANVLAAAIIRRRAEDVRRRLLERVMHAQEEERRRIARELHDETGQVLVSLSVGLRTVEAARSLRQAQQRAGRLGEIAAQAIDEVGRLARGLHPSVLQDLGLGPALARHAVEHGKLLGIKVSVAVVGLGSRRLPADVETSLYRIVQEAITNVGKHARASRADVVLRRKRAAVELRVKDDGCGFEVEHELRAAIASGRLGLQDIRERAALLGGEAAIVSKPGKGTTVRVRIPLRETKPASVERT